VEETGSCESGLLVFVISWGAVGGCDDAVAYSVIAIAAIFQSVADDSLLERAWLRPQNSSKVKRVNAAQLRR
jgi:hypothetical protein